MLLSLCIAALTAVGAEAGNLFRSAAPFAARSETGEMVFWLVIFGVAIAAICAAGFLITHFANRRRYNSHSSLFSALCNVHGLDRNTRAMLKQVARFHALAQPARIFTEPEWLDPAALGTAFAPKAEQLLALRQQLFTIEKNTDS